MDKTLKFTEEELNYLKQFAKVYEQERKEDATADPIVIVQDLHKESGTREDYDKIIYYDEETGQEIEKIDDFIENLREKHDLTKDYIIDLKEYLENNNYFEDCEKDIFIRALFEKHTYKPVAYFFTKEEARKYMQYQSHNLVSPRIYTANAGYGNYGDYPILQNLLLKIGKELIKKGA
jgi:hypothetical protein